VVEATGVRDIPSGPLLRIGHDRFVPGLQELVATVRERSRGRTRLFIQIIDFLSVKRRPTAEQYFARFLRVEPRHFAAFAAATGRAAADEAALRCALAAADDATHERVLDERELEALRFGYCERVIDVYLL